MSIYAKEFTLPDSCYVCDLGRSEQNGDACPFYGCDDRVQQCYQDKRHPECPLIFVPDYHGPLIDAEELEKAAYELARKLASDTIHIDAIIDTLIGHSPVIIKGGNPCD